MKKIVYLTVLLAFFFSCKQKESKMEVFKIDNNMITQTIDSLLNKHGDQHRLRIEKGVQQMAVLWQEADGSAGDFYDFCQKHFISEEKELKLFFEKYQRNIEVLWGNYNRISIDLKLALHLDMGEIQDIDMRFGSYNPAAHLTEDFFANQIAFNVALNFPFYSLQDKEALSKDWSRLDWAYARMGDIYTSRIPAALIQNVSETTTRASTYIYDYNIFVGKLLDNKNKQFFPEDMMLISHWGLRDELKANYENEEGLEKQQIIYEVMKHIILQTIPANVINNNEYQWNPISNEVLKDGKKVDFSPEDNVRYQYLLDNFLAMKEIDAYSPHFPTYSLRKFEEDMEIAEKELEHLFIELCSSPQVREVAALIKKRLGRDLKAYDIWYDGFKARSSIPQEKLDKIVKERYPDKDAFEKDLPQILIKLGFAPEKADFLSSKIAVDASRGAGHAWGAAMKSEKARLRTRIGEDGMNYKGYNIAMHEFGHNVEQTITLQDVDNYILRRVPNTAFTEALAFIFQKRDLQVLGIKDNDPMKEHLETLDVFWSTYEIMGVSLVDMYVWRWMYDNPDATAEQLKKAVIDIATDVWNKYYAEAFGIKDEPVLAIYSHMIYTPLYLSAYPLGHLIEFQIEQHIAGKNFADEIYRIFTPGRITPQAWMKNAVGMEISVKPLLTAVDKALVKMR